MKKIKLGDVCKFIDYRGKTPQKTANGIPLITAQIIKDGFIQEPQEFISPEIYNAHMRRGIPKKGDVVLTTEAPLGEVAQIRTDERLAFAQRVIILQADEKILHNAYLLYALKYKPFKDRILGKASGTTVFGIRASELKEVELEVPSLETQKKISAVLSVLDDKIALNKKMNATLEAMAKTLYDYWFVQFDFPDENGKPYKTSGGKMIFSSELGRDIPVGWKVGTLKTFGTLKNGINYDKNTIGDYCVKIVNVKDISNSSFSIATESLDDINLPAEQIRKYLTTSKDILIARSGIPGAVRTLADKNFSSIYCGFIISFQPSNELWKNFLMLTLQKHYEIISTQSSGTIMQNITQDTLKNFRLIVPPMSVLEKFNRAIEPMISEIKKNILESRRLVALRDWLLPMLMNGQVNFK